VPFQELVPRLAAIMQIRLAKTSCLMMLEQYQSKWIWIHKQVGFLVGYQWYKQSKANQIFRMQFQVHFCLLLFCVYKQIQY
jgi:hypothetical protein